MCMYICMHGVFEFVFGTTLLGPFEVISVSTELCLPSFCAVLDRRRQPTGLFILFRRNACSA